MKTGNHKKIWILAEQNKGKICDISYELLFRACELSQNHKAEISALILCDKVEDDELKQLISRGADKVICVQAPELGTFLPEPYAMCMRDVVERFAPDIILAGATSVGRTLMPYIAAMIHTGLTADCTQLDIEQDTGNLLQTRPAIGGNIMATIKTPSHRPQMATIRPKSTPQAKQMQGRAGTIIRISPKQELLSSRIVRIGFEKNEEELSLSDAEKVVVVGRGIKKAENIAIVREFAEMIGAALGATRDVVDRGWLSYPHQIGLSGKTITPKLYIGLGVSGAIQHLAGMQTSETIIAVNKDADAQIFKVADFGIVGDIFEVLPTLLEQLRQKGF